MCTFERLDPPKGATEIAEAFQRLSGGDGRGTSKRAGEGVRAGRSFPSLAADPLPQSGFLLAPNQDGEGDDVHDQLSQAYEKRFQVHQVTASIRHQRFR